MQVQRGLGSSKLAIASVGGTINFLTRSADMKQGGVIRLGIGGNDFLKHHLHTIQENTKWLVFIILNEQTIWFNIHPKTEYEYMLISLR